MEYIRQRTRGDCGVACIAMLVGVSYETAWDVSKPYMNHPDGNIPFEVLCPVFHALGFKTAVLPFHPDNAPDNSLCEVRYTVDGHEVWHYVVWDAVARRFCDPQRIAVEIFEVTRFLKVG